MISDQILEQGLDTTLDQTDFPQLGALYRGKVRDNYIAGNRRFIVVTDRISAFDVVLGTIPFKGQILNGMASYWFEHSKEIAPNHLIDVPDPAVSVVRECVPFPVEMIVRGYLTGSSPTSLWTSYSRGERTFCGHELPDGLSKHQRLETPLVTPTTKATAGGGHDENISAAEVVKRGLCTAREFEELSALCLKLFDLGTRLAAERGLILADTKYELGQTPDGPVFIDEIHTPDSSRYWYADSYEQALESGGDPRALDKDYLRRRLKEDGYLGQGPAPELSRDLRIQTAKRYVEIYEQVTGQPFEPDLEPPLERIIRNLSS